MALWLFQWPSSTVPLQNLHPATVGFCSSGLGDNPFILTIKSENIVYFRSNKTPGESDGQIRSDEPMNLTTGTTRTLISPQSSEVFVHHFLKKKRLYLLDVFSEVFLLSTLKKRKLWFSPLTLLLSAGELKPSIYTVASGSCVRDESVITHAGNPLLARGRTRPQNSSGLGFSPSAVCQSMDHGHTAETATPWYLFWEAVPWAET